jgi:hypothetical protein
VAVRVLGTAVLVEAVAALPVRQAGQDRAEVEGNHQPEEEDGKISAVVTLARSGTAILVGNSWMPVPVRLGGLAGYRL